jgi:hypothetical protein
VNRIVVQQIVTFEQLVKIEPRLKDLQSQAEQIDGSNPDFCANEVWYRALKPILLNLVGWEAAHPLLKSKEAYDCAYQRIYERLPNCKHESSVFCV